MGDTTTARIPKSDVSRDLNVSSGVAKEESSGNPGAKYTGRAAGTNFVSGSPMIGR